MFHHRPGFPLALLYQNPRRSGRLEGSVMAAFFINGKPAPSIQSFTVTMDDGSVHRAVSQAAMDRIAHGAEILAEARMRERLADPATWDALRNLYPPPIMLEGGGM